MSQKNKQTIFLKTVLKKYLKNEASAEECEAINTWYHHLGTENEGIAPFQSLESKQELGNSIKKYLTYQSLEKRKSIRSNHIIKYAAVFLMIIAAGLFVRNRFLHQNSARQSIVFQSDHQAAKEITLTDGTKVLLNVDSKLVVAESFGDSIRGVSLEGEAFFRVAKDKEHPFIIKSGKLKTQVLGTSFNINAYDDLNTIKIAVLTGKVKVSEGNETLATGMTRGTSLTYNKADGHTLLKSENVGFISSWRESKLYIDHATITEIASQLRRYYHLPVVFDQKTENNKRYTIRFEAEPATRVMEILSILTKRKFTYHLNQITIK